MFALENYTFALPNERIAQFPAQPADTCKLLVANKSDQKITDATFADLPHFLSRKSLLVRNITKVIQARIPLTSFA